MRAEVINNVPNPETRSYLRVASIHHKSPLFFLYIGQCDKAISLLSGTTRSGLIATNLSNAAKLITSNNFDPATLDFIVVDIAYDSTALQQFQQQLRLSHPALAAVPVIYNEVRLKEIEASRYAALVDEVIDLHNWQFDLNGKVSFLKKAKAYSSQQQPPATARIRATNCLYKRALDITVSLSLLILALPLFLLIALAIRLESRGPIFYNARRAGRGFRIFKFYKFRTMVVNADKKIDTLAHLNQYTDAQSGPKFFKIANDPRITRVGRFLRNTSLDELPQLFNVLKGDMSLVGNRPLPLYEAATLTTNEFVERFMAPAGITGLWQIKKRGKSDMSTQERISLDISYARNSNLLYDLWIMANTPGALLQKSDV